MMTFSRKFFIAAIVFALAAGFGGGYGFLRYHETASMNSAIRQIVNQDAGKPLAVDFGLFWRVWNSLHEKYVDTDRLDTQKLLYGAVSGMVNSVGDPYTVFFEPATSKKFQEEISGAFGGVGMEIGKRNNVLTVIAPIKDTPAFKAGIKAGDRILAIDGTSTANLSVEEAVNLIRGRKGTRVKLNILPLGSQEARDIQLVRDTIKVPTVEWKMINDHVAYMEVFAFNETVDAEFKKTAQAILESKADRLIIDLRNNPGGLLDSAIDLAGWFLPKNSLAVIEDFGNGKRNEFRTSGEGALKGFPTVFLMNGGSASASEILAGAVHDNRGVRLVGEKSFGKGSVQELENYADGSSLKVTVAKWLTPAGISISDKGIEPDVKIAIDPKQVQDGTVEVGTPGKDPQLDKAIEIIK